MWQKRNKIPVLVKHPSPQEKQTKRHMNKEIHIPGNNKGYGEYQSRIKE